jgi:cytochrome P450
MTETSAPVLTAAARALPTRYPAHVGAGRLYGEEFARDPAPTYRALRERHGAVAPVLLEGDLPAWLVLGYRETHYMLSHRDLYDRRGSSWNARDLVPAGWPLQWIFAEVDGLPWLDGPEHERRTGVLHDALAAVDQFAFHAGCERIADRLVDSFSGDGSADLMARYAMPFPIAALAGLVGFPARDIPGVARHIAAVFEGTDHDRSALVRVFGEVRALLEARRANPRFDVATRLAGHASAPPADRLAGDVLTLFGAGQLATANWIGNTLRLLLADPRFAAARDGGVSSVGAAMETALWEESPASNLAARFVTQPLELGGYRLQPGDMVLLSLTGANTDPLINGDQALPAGGRKAHLAFSHGPHGCPFPARELSEVMVRAAVEVLLDRLPDLELAVPVSDLRWQESIVMHGPARLPVAFAPAGPR